VYSIVDKSHILFVCEPYFAAEVVLYKRRRIYCSSSIRHCRRSRLGASCLRHSRRPFLYFLSTQQILIMHKS